MFRLFIFLFLAGLSLTFTTAQAQTTRFVSTTGTTTNPASATSWATSTTNLQGAINASNANDQVWVAAGVYKPTTTTGPDSRTISFAMKNGVAIYGGFVGNETSLNQRPAINPVSGNPSNTTLSGEIGDPNSTTDNSQHVFYHPGSLSLTTTAILDGVVITDGVSGGNVGGGMFNNGIGAFCNPLIRNCVFQRNSANQGGAIFNSESSPTLTNCRLQDNSANYGGAMQDIAGAFRSSSPTLTNCLFLSNSATFSGGAINNDSGYKGNIRPVLINVSFQNNTSPRGGALYNDGSYPTLTNCSFQNNTSANGGAMYNQNGFYGPSAPVLTNCVLFGNGGSNTFFNKTDIGGSATYSLFEPTVTGIDLSGPGNLTNVTTSPFASSTSVALSTCSPAINAGLNSANAIPTDLANQPRIVGGTIDMGAIEFQGTPFVAITTQPPGSVAGCSGNALTAGVSVSGTVTGYQWYKANTPVADQTTATLSLTSLQTSDAGSYSVVVTGGCNSVTSTAFMLTVSSNVAPVVVITLPNGSTVNVAGNLPTLILPVGNSVLQASGGVLYERLIILDRINGYEIRQKDQNITGIFPINRTGLFTLTVTGAGGCSKTVQAVVQAP